MEETQLIWQCQCGWEGPTKDLAWTTLPPIACLCPTCGAMGGVDMNIKQEEVATQPIIEENKCPECERSFTSPIGLRNHMRAHKK